MFGCMGRVRCCIKCIFLEGNIFYWMGRLVMGCLVMVRLVMGCLVIGTFCNSDVLLWDV